MTGFHKNLPILDFDNQEQFAAWLAQNYKDQGAYWLKIAKRGSQQQTISYEDAREAALMFWWIDGLLNRLDDNYYLLKFCHRRTKSNWSDINIALVEQLIKDNKMQPEGLAEYEAALSDGRIAANKELASD